MNFSIRSLVTMLQFLGLLCLGLLTLSCGGGGGKALAGNNTLPVLRSYSGVVQNGALILTDPQTQTSISITDGSVQDGASIQLQAVKGIPATFSNPAYFRSNLITYSLTLSPASFTAKMPIKVTMPDVINPTQFRSVELIYSLSDPNAEMPIITQASASPGFVDGLIYPPNLNLASTNANGTITVYLSVIDYPVMTSRMLKKSSSRSAGFIAISSSAGNSVIPPDVQDVTGKRICVFFHGRDQEFISDEVIAACQYLAKLTTGNPNNKVPLYDYVFDVDYDWTSSIKDSGESVATVLLPYTTAASSCDLIGYSQGGLVARWAIEKAASKLASSSLRLITLGTPHDGIPILVAKKLHNELLTLKKDTQPPSEGELELINWEGKTPEDGAVDFIGALNSNLTSNGMDYYTVAGTSATSASSATDEGAVALIYPQIADMYLALSDENKYPTSECDGIIGQYSANWSGLGSISTSWANPDNKQSSTFPETHLGLINLLPTSHSIDAYLFKGLQVTIK